MAWKPLAWEHLVQIRRWWRWRQFPPDNLATQAWLWALAWLGCGKIPSLFERLENRISMQGILKNLIKAKIIFHEFLTDNGQIFDSQSYDQA